MSSTILHCFNMGGENSSSSEHKSGVISNDDKSLSPLKRCPGSDSLTVIDTFRSISPPSDLLMREETAVEANKRVSFQTLSRGFLEDSTTLTSSHAPIDECGDQDDWLNGDLSAAWSDSTDSSAYTVTMNEDFPEVDYPYHTEPLKTRSPLFFKVGRFQNPGKVGDMAPLSPLSPLSPIAMWQTSASACVYSCRSARIQSNRIVGDLIDRGVDNHDREGSTIH